MSNTDIALDLVKSIDLIKSASQVASVSNIELSLKQAAALRAASIHLRELSEKNRQIAQDTRALGKDVALRHGATF